MIRGILIGFLGGGAIGLVFAAVVSLVSPLPARIELDSQAAAQVSEPRASTQPGLATPSEADAPLEAETIAVAPAQSEGEGTPLADRASAPRPTPADVAEVEGAPLVEEAADVSVSALEPVLPVPQADAIATPSDELDDVEISLRPVQRPQVVATETATLSAPSVSASPSAPTTINVPIETTRADVAPDDLGVTPPAVIEEENGVQTSLLQPATELDEAFPQLTSTRLPTVGSSQVAADASGVGDSSPLVQFAAKYERVNTRPILSVVLIDEGKSDLDLTILRDFPFPLSIAVNPANSNAVERARQFRSLGMEVLAVLELPEGAKPEDVEVNLATGLTGLPESVAILEGGSIGLQESREVSDQVISFVKASGHGLVMLPKGLNTAQKMAARDGVPSVTVFRDIDSNGQTEVVMRRFLDQAAFKARQQDGVLMLGRLRQDTLAALAVWTLADRASTVALAPASVLLRAQTEG
ncbi:divergent polysaccharide deacetylase family protein [Cognatishimia sp.]|uniref:divergent polysaccharide deacetylase family protein n=1 Tax=Cognatishimia sp. TaxID=2211648 RepID=UPI0035181017